MSEKFIQKMHMKKGALHKELGVPEGKKIPKKKLEKAEHAGGKLGKRARLAETLGKMHHGKKKQEKGHVSAERIHAYGKKMHSKKA